MVNLLKANAADLGVTADAAHLDATVSRTLAQLQQNTAVVTASMTDTGNRLKVTVDVANLAGHKFPSGLPFTTRLAACDGFGYRREHHFRIRKTA